jgi:hypothetical protein
MTEEDENQVVHVRAAKKGSFGASIKRGNVHVNLYRVHCIFSMPEFDEGSDDVPPDILVHNGYTLLCTAHAICDHLIATYPAVSVGDGEYAWFLLMAGVYVHRASADIPYDDKSFAGWFCMDEMGFLLEFLHFCRILFDMPPSSTKIRMAPHLFDMSVDSAGRSEYTGPVIRIYPFEL